MRHVPIAGPSITELEIAYVADAARNGWYAHANDYIEKFESAFRSHTGRRYATSLPSCTSGLHLALRAIGVGAGDEVIVPDCTWIASCAPISYVGAHPVFVDIDSKTWCISPDALEARISPRTKAIICVDLYGHMADWDRITEIADRHEIPVIEDAAEAIGSTFRGRPAGAFGCCSVFSFHGSKTMTTGEGGMMVYDDPGLHDRIYRLRDHGRAPGDVMFFNEEVGFKYKMSALQAALGLAQLERIADLVEAKRKIFEGYKKRFAGWSDLSLNPDFLPVRNSYWMTTALIGRSVGLTKEALIPALAAAGVAARPFFYPLSMIPAYAKTDEAYRARNINAVAYDISARALNLPSALILSEDDLDYVVDTLQREIAASLRRQGPP